MYYLFLDDERDPSDVTWIRLPDVDWVIARSQAEFSMVIDLLGMPRYISYDHDLGEGFGTGMAAAAGLIDQLIDLGQKHPEYVVHSMNPVGARNITMLIEGWNSQSGLDN